MLRLTAPVLRTHIAEGLTYPQIATLYGLTTRQVRHRANAYGITTALILGRRRSGRVTKLPEPDFLAVLIECGMSTEEAGSLYGATARAVRDALERGGYRRGEDGIWRLDGRRCVQCSSVFKSTGPANVVCPACKKEYV